MEFATVAVVDKRKTATFLLRNMEFDGERCLHNA